MPDAHMEKLGRLCCFSRTPQLQPRGCDSNTAVGGTEVALLLLSPWVPVVWARPPPVLPWDVGGSPCSRRARGGASCRAPRATVTQQHLGNARCHSSAIFRQERREPRCVNAPCPSQLKNNLNPAAGSPGTATSKEFHAAHDNPWTRPWCRRVSGSALLIKHFISSCQSPSQQGKVKARHRGGKYLSLPPGVSGVAAAGGGQIPDAPRSPSSDLCPGSTFVLHRHPSLLLLLTGSRDPVPCVPPAPKELQVWVLLLQTTPGPPRSEGAAGEIVPGRGGSGL